MRPDLAAALLWDVEALRASEERGTREFIDAMSLMGAPKESGATDSLGRAASGIWAEMSGESELARAVYRGLSESEDCEDRLLGLFLLCWTDLDLDPVRIGEAREEMERLVEDSMLKARLTMKLIYAAFEYKWDELLPALFELAKGWAADGSLLMFAIEREAYTLFGDAFPVDGGGEADPLVEQRSISSLLGGAAQEALRKEVEEEGRSPWTLSFSVGDTALREPYAAEMQARWAGAIWLRAEVQTQLAVHLLRGGAGTPGEYASAVALWALGRGQQIPQVVNLAEPHFDDASADFVVSNLMRSDAVAAPFEPRLVETAIECWDLISEETAVALLDRLEPVATDHPIIRRVATLFSLLSLRAPGHWMNRLEELSPEQARAVVYAMSPAVAERVSQAGAKCLYDAALSGDEIEANALPTVATLMGRLSNVEEFEPADVVPARVVVRLAWSDFPMLDESELNRVVGELTDRVSSEVEEARTGSASIGPESPASTLASAVVKLGEIPGRTHDLMIAIATDASLPRNMRYDAVKFLATGAHNNVLDLGSRPRLIDEIPEAGSEAFWGSYSPSLMRAAKMDLAMAAGRVEEYLPSLLVLSRDPDPRVRIDASEAAGLGRAVENHDLLETILLSGLFDPSSKVVQRALFGFSELLPQRSATQVAFGERLRELFARSGREVRAAIASLISQVELPSGLRDIGTELARRAAEDRSYEVRAALAEEAPEKR